MGRARKTIRLIGAGLFFIGVVLLVTNLIPGVIGAETIVLLLAGTFIVGLTYV